MVGIDAVFAERDRLSPAEIARDVPDLPPAVVAALTQMPASDREFKLPAVRNRDRFRLDAIDRILKDAQLRDDPPAEQPFPLPLHEEYARLSHIHSGNAPDVSLVAGSFNGAAIIHPRRLLGTPALAALPQDRLLASAALVGADPRTVERVLVLLDPFPGGNVAFLPAGIVGALRG